MAELNLETVFDNLCEDIYDRMELKNISLEVVLLQLRTEYPDTAEIFEAWYREGDDSGDQAGAERPGHDSDSHTI